MTVCIGAICESGETAVVASDRMVTSNYPNIEFEHTKKKIYKISDRCVSLTAGNAIKPIELIPCVQEMISKTKSPGMDKIIEKMKDAYQYLRYKDAEELLLKPRALNKDDFYKYGANIFPAQLFYQIDEAFTRYDYGIDVLVVGMDNTGARIFSIRNPGISNCYDTLGFASIGSGYLHATQTLISHNYNPSYDISEALNIVYTAKRAAEKAPGVGHKTDMAIIGSEGITFLPEEALKRIETIYDEVYKEPIEEIKIKSKKFNEYINTLIPSDNSEGISKDIKPEE